MHNNRHIFALIVVLVITAIFASAALAQDDSAAVAKVNGKTITLEALKSEAIARYGPQVLEHLIIGRAIEQAAEKAGVEVTEPEVQKRTVNMEKRLEWQAPISGINFAKWLANNNLTPASFRQKIYHTMLLEKMVEDDVEITEQQVADYYRRNREQLRQPERVKVAHIVVADEQTANDIRNKITAGDLTFEEAASKHSLDVWTKGDGGEWGYVAQGDDPFRKAALSLEEDGAISEVVQTPMGFHIIKRLHKKPEELPPFEDVKEELKSDMESQKISRLTQQLRMEILSDVTVERLIQFNANGTYSVPGDNE
ncbi:MAG: peptidyl-prolyl cis-trans isomerase [Armatimonadota bacterium]